MKKTLILAIALTLVFAGVAFGGVVNSKHDMSIEDALNTASTAVCEFCHHPHKGSSGNTNNLLWNKNYVTTSTYAPYTASSTMDSTAATINMNAFGTTGQYATALCMSCHDGANSDNQYIRASGGGTTSANITLTGAIDLGSTLADDHPVNFQWTTMNDANITIPATYTLYSGYFQCGTCHNVHNAGTTPVQFLRANNTDSSMCLACHTNK